MQKHNSSDFDLHLMPKLNAEAGGGAPVTVRVWRTGCRMAGEPH